MSRRYSESQIATFERALDEGKSARAAGEIIGMGANTATSYATKYRHKKRAAGKQVKMPTRQRTEPEPEQEAKSTAETTVPPTTQKLQLEIQPMSDSVSRELLQSMTVTMTMLVEEVVAQREQLTEINLTLETICNQLAEGIRLAPAKLPEQQSNGKPPEPMELESEQMRRGPGRPPGSRNKPTPKMESDDEEKGFSYNFWEQDETADDEVD